MKRNIILFADRLIVMALACVAVFGLSSCSDDDEGGRSIVGSWGCGTESYDFSTSGTGMYRNGSDVWGDFSYNVSGNTVYMRITYVNSSSQSTWRDEKSGTYHPDDDTFFCGGKKFTRR